MKSVWWWLILNILLSLRTDPAECTSSTADTPAPAPSVETGITWPASFIVQENKGLVLHHRAWLAGDTLVFNYDSAESVLTLNGAVCESYASPKSSPRTGPISRWVDAFYEKFTAMMGGTVGERASLALREIDNTHLDSTFVPIVQDLSLSVQFKGSSAPMIIPLLECEPSRPIDPVIRAEHRVLLLGTLVGSGPGLSRPDQKLMVVVRLHGGEFVYGDDDAGTAMDLIRATRAGKSLTAAQRSAAQQLKLAEYLSAAQK